MVIQNSGEVFKEYSKIRPYLDEPFQFEIDIYNKLPEDKLEIAKLHNLTCS